MSCFDCLKLISTWLVTCKRVEILEKHPAKRNNDGEKVIHETLQSSHQSWGNSCSFRYRIESMEAGATLKHQVACVIINRGLSMPDPG